MTPNNDDLTVEETKIEDAVELPSEVIPNPEDELIEDSLSELQPSDESNSDSDLQLDEELVDDSEGTQSDSN